MARMKVKQDHSGHMTRENLVPVVCGLRVMKSLACKVGALSLPLNRG